MIAIDQIKVKRAFHKMTVFLFALLQRPIRDVGAVLAARVIGCDRRGKCFEYVSLRAKPTDLVSPSNGTLDGIQFTLNLLTFQFVLVCFRTSEPFD